MKKEVFYRAVWPEIPSPEKWLKYVTQSFDANRHTNFGPACKQFEEALAHRYGINSTCCVTTSSATSGLAACLIAHQATGSVICPAFTFPATASAILMAGCAPIVVDIDPNTLAISAESLDVALKRSGAKHAIVVAPYGVRTDFSNHVDVCQSHDTRLIIDNAAGLGVERDHYEKSEDVDEVFSLHATKPFNIGEGGVIFSNKVNNEKLRAAINFGIPSHTLRGLNQPPYWGINGKLSEIPAAIGLAVLEEMDQRVKSRQEMATRWLLGLAEIAQVKSVFTDSTLGPWQVFPILLRTKTGAEELVNAAARVGVELRRYYSPSLGACQRLQRLSSCRVSEDISSRVVTLPVRSRMPFSEQAELVARTIAAIESAT